MTASLLDGLDFVTTLCPFVYLTFTLSPTVFLNLFGKCDHKKLPGIGSSALRSRLIFTFSSLCLTSLVDQKVKSVG